MTGSAAHLIAPGGGDDEKQFVGEARVRVPGWASLPTLTIGLLGVQVLWSVELGYASPYLLSLGLTKSLMAIVFIAGPLSGLIVQPLIGAIADNSKSRFGRRRPYMMYGCIFCAGAMLLLGFTREFSGIFAPMGSTANDILTIWLAVFAIYCIDFSINAVQAVDRALLVDTLPTAEQAAGNAWAARMLGFGSVAGYFIGETNMGAFSFIGKTQLQILSVISGILLVGAHIVTCFLVTERVQISSHTETKGRRGLLVEMKKIWQGARTLPRVIKQICIIQFFAWLGWFPVLFYTTVYIGDLYKRNAVEYDEDEGTRVGNRALFWSSVVSLAANIFMPMLVQESRKMLPEARKATASTWGKMIQKVQIHLATLWAISHAVFALCMAGTLFTSSVWGASVLIIITGFPWAITQWAPFSLLAEAILSEPTAADTGVIILTDTRTLLEEPTEETRFLVGEADDDDDGVSHRRSAERRRSISDSLPMGTPIQPMNGPAANSLEDGLVSEPPVENGLSDKAGVILGIHNIFIVIPQFVVTAMSSAIFAILEPEKSVLHGSHPGKIPGNSTVIATETGRQEDIVPPQGPNSIAIIFRIGGLFSAVAFVLCWRLAREIRHR